MRTRRVQAFGFSLLEVVLGLALSALLILGLIKLMLSFEASYRLQKAWLKMHQEAYFLSSYLLPRMARAGFSCEGSLNTPFVVQGYEAGHLPHFITSAQKVRGDVVVIGLCARYEGRLQFKQFAYYVGETTRSNQQGQFIRVLYEKALDGNRIELEEGVQALTMEYGLKSETGALSYYPASKITDWTQVVSLNLNFVLGSIEPVLINSKKQFLLKPWKIYVYLRQSA